jgi:hypothetical protein
MCFAAKWYGTRGLIFDAEWQSSHKKMVSHAHRLLSECDAVIHYNGRSFDIPVLNKEFLLAEMSPPPPYRQVDLYRVARSTFRFASNKLDHVSQELGNAGKVRHRGQSLWTGCMNGDPACQKEMERYNKRDVTELEKTYERFLPWIRLHPNHGLYDGGEVCPNCGSEHLQRRGYARTVATVYPRLQCQGCGAWARGTAGQVKPTLRHAA